MAAVRVAREHLHRGRPSLVRNARRQTPRMDLAAWKTIEIVDVDGVSFTPADLIGVPVLVVDVRHVVLELSSATGRHTEGLGDRR